MPGRKPGDVIALVAVLGTIVVLTALRVSADQIVALTSVASILATWRATNDKSD
jgi:hypothetical protein